MSKTDDKCLDLNNEKYNNNCKTNKEIVIKKDQAKQTIIYSKLSKKENTIRKK